MKILIIDSSDVFADKLSQNLNKAKMSDVSLNQEDWAGNIDHCLDYDAVIVGGFLNGGHKTLEILDELTKVIPPENIFVTSNSNDLSFYKDLVNYRVKGYLDQEEPNVDFLIKSVGESKQIKNKLLQLSARLDQLKI